MQRKPLLAGRLAWQTWSTMRVRCGLGGGGGAALWWMCDWGRCGMWGMWGIQGEGRWQFLCLSHTILPLVQTIVRQETRLDFVVMTDQNVVVIVVAVVVLVIVVVVLLVVSMIVVEESLSDGIHPLHTRSYHCQPSHSRLSSTPDIDIPLPALIAQIVWILATTFFWGVSQFLRGGGGKYCDGTCQSTFSRDRVGPDIVQLFYSRLI